MRRKEAPRRGKSKLEVCAMVAIAPLVFARAAHASHPPVQPELQQILIDRSQARAVALGLRFGGYVVSRDGTGPWSSVCPAAVGYEDTETYPGVALADGSLVVSTGASGIARSRDGCGWNTWHPDFPALFVDLRLDPHDTTTLMALSSSAEGAGFATQLWTSSDGGESWLPHRERLPADLDATSFALSPSNSAVLYVAGNGTYGAELLRSNDGGTTWHRFIIEHAGVPRLVDVVSAAQDVPVVMLDAHQHDEPGSVLTDSVQVSLDAGAHFGSLYTSTGDLTAAALSADGQLAFGGPEDGLWVVDVARADEPKQRPLPAATSVQALAWAGAQLYAGVGGPSGELSLFEWDAGATGFFRVLSLCEVSPALECASDSAVGAACSGETEAQVSLNPEALAWCTSPPTPSPAPSRGPSPRIELEASSCGITPLPRPSNELGPFVVLVLSLGGLRKRSVKPAPRRKGRTWRQRKEVTVPCDASKTSAR